MAGILGEQMEGRETISEHASDDEGVVSERSVPIANRMALDAG